MEKRTDNTRDFTDKDETKSKFTDETRNLDTSRFYHKLVDKKKISRIDVIRTAVHADVHHFKVCKIRG